MRQEKKQALEERKQQLREKLIRELPPVISRHKVEEITGGVVTVGALRKFDCTGEGPAERIKAGRRVGYDREVFVEWFINRCQFLLAKPEL
jgi:hypothetical protein